MSENKEYRRSLVMTPKTTAQFNQFLPSKDKQSGYVPVALRKKRTDSQSDDNRRSWASPMFTEEDGSFSRLLQKASDSDGSQSLGDIPDEEAVQKVRYEDLQKMREKIKHNEDQWQDDLTKWKNRRKSVNSDIMKKKEEREQIEILTSGSGNRKSKTFKEMEEERESQEPGFKSRFSTFSTSEDLDVFDEPTPKTRVLPRRSYTVDNPYSMGRSKVHSLPSLADDEPEAGSLPSDEVETPSNPIQSSLGTTLPTSQEKETSISVSHDILDYPVKNSVFSKPNLLEPTRTNISSPPTEANSSSKPVPKSNNSANPVPAPRQNLSQTSMHKPVSAETKQPIAPLVSASLPRSYQRSDSARITSVVTPRPFGTTSTKVTSLPRSYTVDDSQKRFNGETNSGNNMTASNRYAAFLKEDSQTSSMQSSNENEGEEEEQVFPPIRSFSSVTPVSRVAPQPKTVSSVNSTQQENYSDMRISLNQKPNSNHDFGFQSNWDSTGVVVKSIQQGSPAEMCHLQVGDKILAVNGQKVADMSYEKWKRSMDEALQEGSLFMDIRRQGKNSFPEPYTNTSLNFSSLPAMDSTVKTVNVSSHSVNSLSSNGINGGIREEPVNLRSNESLSLKNLKRRSEFFEQGGSENQIPDPLAPSLSASSTRWSWDLEEERRRQEKWQKEQDRQLQEKYRQDQEKLDEEFRKAQQVAVTAGSKNLEEMRNLKLEQEASRLALKEEEERKRREEQERLEVERKEKQKHLEEERKKKEEQKRLEEEMKRREEEKKREEQKRLEEQRKKEEEELKRREEENKRREEEAQRLQKSREEEEKRRQEAQRRLQANDGEYTFPELSYFHRTKSKSTPELDDIERTDIKGVYSKHRGLAGWLLEEELRRKKDPHVLRQQTASELELERRNILSAMRYSNPERAISSGLGQSSLNKASQDKKEPATQAELERQQIIQDMKKKNALLTDSSWIRQNSMNSVNKEPSSLPMRRGESLDNLDMTTNRTSWRSSWTPGTTSSIPDYSRPYSSYSSSSSIQSGRPDAATLPSFQSLNSQRPSFSQSTATNPENQSSSRNRSVSGKKMCTKCAMPLGKGAAMIIESLGLCYHLHCFKCIQCKTDLGGSESGAEVRIRNKQLFCNSCYMRVKTGQPTAM